MKKEYIMDENGFKLNMSETSKYLGVYRDTLLEMYVVSLAPGKEVVTSYKSSSVNVSKHICELEAAWYYNEFVKDIQSNVSELEYVGQYNWMPNTIAPEFLKSTVTTNDDIINYRSKCAEKQITKNDTNVKDLWKENNEVKNKLLRNLTITGREALTIILECKNKKIKDLTDSIKQALKPYVNDDKVIAYDILTKINVMV